MMDPDEQEEMLTSIMTATPLQTRGPPSKEMSYTAPEVTYHSPQVRQFMANGVGRSGHGTPHHLGDTVSVATSRQIGPSMSSAMSHAVSIGSSAGGNLTPQMPPMQTPRSPEHLDLLKDDDDGNGPDEEADDDRKSREKADDTLSGSAESESESAESGDSHEDRGSMMKTPEFGAAFKPDDYTETKMDDLDDELMKEFEDIDSSGSSEEDEDGDSAFETESVDDDSGDRGDGDVGRGIERGATPNAEEVDGRMLHNGHHVRSEDEVSDKDKPVLVQSESTMARSTNGLLY